MDDLYLPAADHAEIGEDKLRNYVLDPEHPVGRHKARMFASALGIDQENWPYLRDAIASKLEAANVSAVRESAYGFLYEVPMLIDGLNGATEEVITAWFIPKSASTPRLVSAYVNRP